MVFNRGTCETKANVSLQHTDSLIGRGILVLHKVRFVENNRVPLHRRHLLNIAEHDTVAGDHEVVIIHHFFDVLTSFRSVMFENLEVRAKVCNLVLPVIEDRGW